MKKRSPGQSPTMDKKIEIGIEMDFRTAMAHVLAGGKVRRASWDNEGQYVKMKDELLMIYETKDERLHYLILCGPDLTATDWIMAD